MKKFLRGPGIYAIIIIVILIMARFFTTADVTDKNINYNDLMKFVRDQQIRAVVVTDKTLVGLKKDTKLDPEKFPDVYDFTIYLPSEEQFLKDASKEISLLTGKPVEQVTTEDFGFTYKSKPVPEESAFLSMLPFLIGLVVIVIIWYFMMQKAQGGGKMMSFGKSRAKLHVESKNKITFQDVAGADEEKEELKEIVDFLRDPKKYLALGARIPKGVLLIGPPGTGKTLLAKAVAGEAGVPFFSISGSDFVEMFVGVGASRVRDLFETAKRNLPCIVFIDEIDAVGRHRGAGLGGGHDEREQTLNQLLVEMDGFTLNEGIIIIAATNRPDILDPALLRPGRFDRQVTVGYPDIKGREAILRVHSRKKPLAQEVDLSVIAKRTPYFTGADLENVMNESAILAARAGKKEITMKELEEAITRVLMGPEKRSHVITSKDRKLVAYHEVGHAIVASKLPYCDPVHEVSIIPRGKAGGYTMTMAEEETHYVTKSKMTDNIAMLMGGRAAEARVMGDISTGASMDIQQASQLARKMILEYGMSDALGPVFLGSHQEIFLGKDMYSQRPYSETLAAQIDKEVRDMLDAGYQTASAIIEKNLDKMHKIVEVLIEKEKLDTEEFNALLNSPEPTAPKDKKPGKPKPAVEPTV
ncbi:MAG: ATP-dependent zinc metalloprotease FtsH [Christensenellales bacterium]